MWSSVDHDTGYENVLGYGTGTTSGNSDQFGKLAAVVLANPPTKQEKFWHVHKHPARPGVKPFEG